MRKTNYHMHTKRCMHASGEDEDYIRSALKNGYEEVGFSDHTPWKYDSDYVSSMRMKRTQLDDYVASITALKEKYKDRIIIKIGLECEYFPKYMPWLKQLIQEYALDYILFGNHFLETDELGICYATACKQEDMMKKYVDEAIEGIKTGLYSYVCHPDLFMRARHTFDEIARRESKRLCIAAKKYDIPLEYNLAGAQYNHVMKTMKYPHIEFWNIAAAVGNKVIIGVDAHEPRAMETDIYREEAIHRLQNLQMKMIDTLPQVDFHAL